jgi:ribonuclease VapC
VIVADTSALVAIVFEEAEALLFAGTLRAAASPKLSSASLAETFIVVAGRTGRDNAAKVLALLDGIGMEVVPVDRRQALLVNEAFLRFGKGRHKASLNYGDCFAYALAKSLDLPLLFKGNDFRHTDVRPAL